VVISQWSLVEGQASIRCFWLMTNDQ
jgi:hypothetical protein